MLTCQHFCWHLMPLVTLNFKGRCSRNWSALRWMSTFLLTCQHFVNKFPKYEWWSVTSQNLSSQLPVLIKFRAFEYNHVKQHYWFLIIIPWGNSLGSGEFNTWSQANYFFRRPICVQKCTVGQSMVINHDSTTRTSAGCYPPRIYRISRDFTIS